MANDKFRFTKVVFDAAENIVDMRLNPKFDEHKYSDVVCERDISYSSRFPEVKLDVFYPNESLRNAQKYRNRVDIADSENLSSSTAAVAKGKDCGKPDNTAVTPKNPVILEIHGGGFTSGDKSKRRTLCLKWAKFTKATVFNVNYGIGENSPCPVPMRQLVDAVNWIAANAGKYNLDLSRFVVTGDSAGAFYACFLTVLQDSEFLQNLFECKAEARITAAMFNCGVYDMKFALNTNVPMKEGICKSLMGQNLDEAQRSKYFEGLTLTDFVTEKFPATLLIYAKNDIFCKGQGERLLQKLTQNGVTVECVCAKSVFDIHCYSLLGFSDMAKHTDFLMLRFLYEHFE